MRSLRYRIVNALGGNAFGQLVTMVTQFAGVPVFLHFWGTEAYGEWLILFSMPAYLAMSDLSFATVAGNEMTMQVATGNRDGALETFQTMALYIHMLSGCIIAILCILDFPLSLDKWLSLTSITNQDANNILMILVLYVLIGFEGGLINAGFRCDGYYACGIYVYHGIRLLEFCSMLAVVIQGGKFIDASVVLLLVRGISTVAAYLFLKTKIPWIHIGFCHVRIGVLRNMVSKGLFFMAFPFANALSVQGVVIVVGAMFGPMALAKFSLLRTMTRFLIQVVTVISYSVWAEMTVAFGASDLPLARKLHSRVCQASLLFTGLLGGAFYITGDWLIELWTGGRIKMDASLFNILLLGAAVNSAWFASSVVSMASNNHRDVAMFYLFTSFVAIAIIYKAIDLGDVAVVLFLADSLMVVYVLRKSLRLLQCSFSHFLKDLFNWSFNKSFLRMRRFG